MSDGRPSRSGEGVDGRYSALHDLVRRRLAAIGQRYTDGRSALVEALAAAGQPLTVAEAVALSGAHGLSLSSTYRNLTLLVDAGFARRVGGGAGRDRFELAEDLAGHHHHVVCGGCGVVADIAASGFEIVGHNIDLHGVCAACRHR